MLKRYFNAAIVYASLAMAGGVFFREYTKYAGFDGATALSFIHTHYFVLGMFFFLLLALLEKAFSFSGDRGIKGWRLAYHAGLNITATGLILRGLAEAGAFPLSRALDASISGVAGIGHAILGAGILALLILIRKSAIRNRKEKITD